MRFHTRSTHVSTLVVQEKLSSATSRVRELNDRLGEGGRQLEALAALARARTAELSETQVWIMGVNLGTSSCQEVQVWMLVGHEGRGLNVLQIPGEMCSPLHAAIKGSSCKSKYMGRPNT